MHLNRWRLAAWGAALALVLLVPWTAMRFTAEVAWDAADFLFASGLLVAAGIAYELAARRTLSPAYRAGAGVALAAAFVLVWANAAVGLIGSEQNPANAMYAGVIGVGVLGALVGRFRPRAMALALLATAAAQVLVAVIALAAGLGGAMPVRAGEVVALTGAFTALWLLSAWLFRRAARQAARPGRGARA
jgi:hypothetical protein